MPQSPPSARAGRDSHNSGDTQTTPPELNDRTEREKREAREQATQQAREAIAQGRPPVASQPQVGLGVVRGATSPSPSRHSKARLKRAARARDRDAWSGPAGVDPDMLGDEPGAEKS